MQIDSYDINNAQSKAYLCTVHVKNKATKEDVLSRAFKILNGNVPTSDMEIKFVGTYTNDNYSNQIGV